jgi:hypothetical protein
MDGPHQGRGESLCAGFCRLNRPNPYRRFADTTACLRKRQRNWNRPAVVGPRSPHAVTLSYSRPRAGGSPRLLSVWTVPSPPCAPGSQPPKRLDAQDCPTPPNPGGQPPQATSSPPTLRACWPSVPAPAALLKRAGPSLASALSSPSPPVTSVTRLCGASCRRGAGSINAAPQRCPATRPALRKQSAGGSN